MCKNINTYNDDHDSDVKYVIGVKWSAASLSQDAAAVSEVQADPIFLFPFQPLKI